MRTNRISSLLPAWRRRSRRQRRRNVPASASAPRRTAPPSGSAPAGPARAYPAPAPARNASRGAPKRRKAAARGSRSGTSSSTRSPLAAPTVSSTSRIIPPPPDPKRQSPQAAQESLRSSLIKTLPPSARITFPLSTAILTTIPVILADFAGRRKRIHRPIRIGNRKRKPPENSGKRHCH